METRSAKRKRLLDQQQFNGAEDRISDLPDVILHQILFLLPIKSIAQTSVLSKRWKIIWYTFPDLDFTTLSSSPTTNSSNPRKTPRKRKKIHALRAMDFVTQVLNRRSKYSDIRVLRLKASLSFSRLNGLIRCAVRHNIQEIDIEVATKDYFNFPRSVINSDTLRVFKLKSHNPGFRLAPNAIMKAGFRSLHTLSLSSIISSQQPSLLDLFSGDSFPLLRNLNLDACFELKRLHISCRGLENLTLGNCYQMEDLEILCPKMEKLLVASYFDAYNYKTNVKIDAPRLKNIVWAYNAVTEKSCVENLNCLNEASVNFFGLDVMSCNQLGSISNFLYGLTNAKCLTLESQCVEILLNYRHFEGVLQPFTNLKSLELHTNFNIQNIPKLARLLRSCPAIHTLIFKIPNSYKAQRRQRNKELWDLSTTSSHEQSWESESEGLESFLHHLKVVKIVGFLEYEDDISFVKFLLKHGSVLQQMILCFGNCHSRGIIRREKIKSQITGFTRASSNAELVFNETNLF